MKKLYPLTFHPLWKPKAWGGESWDLCGFEDDASVVAEGFLADNDLPDILETYMGDLVGDEVFDWYNLHFPLLLKHLHVEDRLSVQVHPDDAVAEQRFDDYGKTECWYVLEAGPDARIWERPTGCSMPTSRSRAISSSSRPEQSMPLAAG